MPARIRMCSFTSPLGRLTCAAVEGVPEEGICLVEFQDREPRTSEIEWLARHYAAEVESTSAPAGVLAVLAEELHRYFNGELRCFSVPLAAPGTAFQRRVWEELLRIPYGGTRSYAEVAAAVGNRNATRAVGAANGANRIAVVVPCHRVVASSGRLGGYGGGPDRKARLLAIEGAVAECPGLWGACGGTTMRTPAGRPPRRAGAIA